VPRCPVHWASGRRGLRGLHESQEVARPAAERRVANPSVDSGNVGVWSGADHDDALERHVAAAKTPTMQPHDPGPSSWERYRDRTRRCTKQCDADRFRWRQEVIGCDVRKQPARRHVGAVGVVARTTERGDRYHERNLHVCGVGHDEGSNPGTTVVDDSDDAPRTWLGRRATAESGRGNGEDEDVRASEGGSWLRAHLWNIRHAHRQPNSTIDKGRRCGRVRRGRINAHAVPDANAKSAGQRGNEMVGSASGSMRHLNETKKLVRVTAPGHCDDVSRDAAC